MKKWTYLVAALLTASAGSLLTGCIDNDEPYGIEQIRVATANLLEAKKAAVEAEAAASNAAVEIEKIKAETEKARIEVQKIAAEAAAKVQEAEAQAKLLQAQAAAAKTEAEAKQLLAEAAIAQANADAIKADTEAKAKLAAAQLEDFIAKSEVEIKQAQLKYDQAVYAFEKLKKDNIDKANDKLYKAVEDAYGMYIAQLASYNSANENYLKAQRALAASEVDLSWNGSEFVSPNYADKTLLEENVEKAQKQIDRLNKQNAEYDEFLANMDGVKASELYVLLQSYKDKLKANEDAIQQLNVKKEEVKLNNKDLFLSLDDLNGQVAKLEGANITINAYTYPGDPAIPGFDKPIKLLDKTQYTVKALTNYNNAIKKLQNAIEEMNEAFLDDNDKAWTTARLNELKRQRVGADEAYDATKATWDKAVLVYANGDTPKIGEAPEAATVKNAVDAYNEAGTGLQATKDALVNAQNAAKTAADNLAAEREKYNGSEKVEATNSWAVYQRALQAAQETREDAIDAAWANANAVETQYNNLLEQHSIAERASRNQLNAASRDYNLAQERANADPTNAALAAAVVTARNAWTAAQTAYNKLLQDNATAESKAWTNVEKARVEARLNETAAWNAYYTARDAARLQYQIAGNGIVAKDPAYAPVVAAETANETAQKALQNAQKAFDKAVTDFQKKKLAPVGKAIDNQVKACGMLMSDLVAPLNEWDKLNTSFNKYVNPADKDFAKSKFPTTKVETLSPFSVISNSVYVNAKRFVRSASVTLYGSLPFDINDEGYGSIFDGEDRIPADRLVALDKAELDKYIEAFLKENEFPFDYYQIYNDFCGTFGRTLYYDNRIEMANLYLNNKDAIDKAIAAVQNQIDAIKATKTEKENAYKAVKKDRDAAQKKVNGLYSAIQDQIDDLDWDNEQYGKIIGTLNTAIAKINDLKDFEGNDIETEAIADAIEEVEGFITKTNNRLENAKKALDKAQYQLDQYNNGYKDLENPLKLDVEMAKAELDRQADALAFLKARLDEVQAIYEAATKKD